jgi:hypothetical protein
MKRVERELLDQFDEFLMGAKVTTLTVKKQRAGTCSRSTLRPKPPFAAGAKRKSEFPDALVSEACTEDDRLHFKELPAYLDAVASEDTTLAAFIPGDDPAPRAPSVRIREKQFGQLGFYLDDQDGEVDEFDLTGVDFYEDIEIISLTHNRAQVEIPSAVNFTAHVTYADPGTGMWDGEDKVLMFQEQRDQSLDREEDDVIIGAEATFEGLDPVVVPCCTDLVPGGGHRGQHGLRHPVRVTDVIEPG